MKNCKFCEKEISNRNVFCNNTCQREHQYRETIKEWLNGGNIMNDGAMKISNNIRRYLFELHNSKCQECDWNKINPHTNKVPLEVEHTDGDSQNNKFENLKLLCPNCHSLTETYKNIGSRKSTRTKRNKPLKH